MLVKVERSHIVPGVKLYSLLYRDWITIDSIDKKYFYYHYKGQCYYGDLRNHNLYIDVVKYLQSSLF